jgi:Tfp pilus assembly protein PilF
MSAVLQNLLKLCDTPRDNALLRFGIANEYAKAQDWPAAAQQAREALARQGDFSAAWKLLGKALAAGGEATAALAAYRDGITVAQARGDLQAVKEMTVFARRIEKQLAAAAGQGDG